MMAGPEFKLVEEPCVQFLTGLGYKYLQPQSKDCQAYVAKEAILEGNNDHARDGQNRVLLREEVIASIQRINGVGEDVARAVYSDLLSQTDNEKWTQWLRGDYSRTVPGESTKQTIRLVDFLNTENNSFVVTNQFYVKAEKSRIPDIVIYVNGIPLVVIEAKKPAGLKDKMVEAFDQIKLYEQDIPRLFHSNAFCMTSNGKDVLYGATGSPSAFWGEWKDAYPRANDSFSNEFEKGLWCLLSIARHFGALHCV